jgi:hypothetical protein
MTQLATCIEATFEVSTEPNIVKEKLTRIAHAVLQIPTPENSQPWEIRIYGNMFEIFHSSERAKLASFPDDLSVLGIGIMSEALDLACGTEGLAVKIRYYLENRTDNSPWIRAEFIPSERPVDPLSAALSLRHTDRRYFAGGSLNDPIFEQAHHEASLNSGANLYFTDTYSKDYLRLIREADKIVMEWDEYRNDLTRWVRFANKQISHTRDGMPWRSFLRNSENLLYYLRSRVWWLAAKLDWFPDVLQRLETRLFDDSSELSPSSFDDGAGVGCITTVSDKPEDLIAAGRLILRIWLLFNQHGYGFHPITNLPGTIYPLHLGKLKLPAHLSHLLVNGHARLQYVFPYPNDEVPIFCFRVGRASKKYPINAKTLRRVDNVKYES